MFIRLTATLLVFTCASHLSKSQSYNRTFFTSKGNHMICPAVQTVLSLHILGSMSCAQMLHGITGTWSRAAARLVAQHM